MGVMERCRHCDKVLMRCRCMKTHEITYRDCPDCVKIIEAGGTPQKVKDE